MMNFIYKVGAVVAAIMGFVALLLGFNKKKAEARRNEQVIEATRRTVDVQRQSDVRKRMQRYTRKDS
jgi:Flp pilus assembly protein TadB